MLLANLAKWKECTIYVAQTVRLYMLPVHVKTLSKLAVSFSEPCSSNSGTRTWSSPARCPVVKRTFEGIILSPEASVSPSNGGPLTRKRRAETSPVIDQPGILHMQALPSHPAPLDASP